MSAFAKLGPLRQPASYCSNDKRALRPTTATQHPSVRYTPTPVLFHMFQPKIIFRPPEPKKAKVVVEKPRLEVADEQAAERLRAFVCNKEYTNMALLLIGPVGCGKSWTVEQAAQQCKPLRSVVDYESGSYFFAASEENILEGLRSSICVSFGRKIVSIDVDGLSDWAAAAVTTLVRSLVGKRLRAAQPLMILSTLETQHARAIRSIIAAEREDAVVRLTVAMDGVRRATGTIMRSLFGEDGNKWPRPLPIRIGALQTAAEEHKDLRRFRLEVEQLFEAKPKKLKESSYVCAACSSQFNTEEELQHHKEAVCGMGGERIKDVWALINQMCSGITNRSRAWQQLAENYDPYTVAEAFAANYLMFAPQPPLPKKYKCKETALSKKEQATIDALEELARAAECASDAAALLWRPTSVRCEDPAASMALHMTSSAPKRKQWKRNEQMSLKLKIRHGKLGDGAKNVQSWRRTRESALAELAQPASDE
ncbi:hypothetical protein EMVG_00152 [Emiliania huxleyi virus PS401]|nr:hypothetical protein EMVG_00152 [Emiliania huxleyi virus PS401]